MIEGLFCVPSQPAPQCPVFRVNPQQSVVEIVRLYPILKSSFDAMGMDIDVNKALAFESLMASCKVQQLSVDDVLAVLHHILKTS
jgi:hypothetical protein